MAFTLRTPLGHSAGLDVVSSLFRGVLLPSLLTAFSREHAHGHHWHQNFSASREPKQNRRGRETLFPPGPESLGTLRPPCPWRHELMELRVPTGRAVVTGFPLISSRPPGALRQFAFLSTRVPFSPETHITFTIMMGSPASTSGDRTPCSAGVTSAGVLRGHVMEYEAHPTPRSKRDRKQPRCATAQGTRGRPRLTGPRSRCQGADPASRWKWARAVVSGSVSKGTCRSLGALTRSFAGNAPNPSILEERASLRTQLVPRPASPWPLLGPRRPGRLHPSRCSAASHISVSSPEQEGSGISPSLGTPERTSLRPLPPACVRVRRSGKQGDGVSGQPQERGQTSHRSTVGFKGRAAPHKPLSSGAAGRGGRNRTLLSPGVPAPGSRPARCLYSKCVAFSPGHVSIGAQCGRGILGREPRSRVPVGAALCPPSTQADGLREDVLQREGWERTDLSGWFLTTGRGRTRTVPQGSAFQFTAVAHTPYCLSQCRFLPGHAGPHPPP